MMDNCTNSMAPSAEELLRLALDEEPLQKGRREHLEHCPICQRRLMVYKQANRQLLSKLYRSACPPVTQLNLYCAGMLSGDEGIDITDHIAECLLCAREIVTIRQVLADFEPFPMLAETPAPQRFVERIIASLVPWKPQLVTRGAVSDVSWPRQYRAQEINISLHLSRSSDGEIILLGLFTSDNPDEAIEEQEGVPVDLYSASDFSATQNAGWHAVSPLEQFMTAKIDDLGNVVFKAVPPGEYVMVVRLPESEVVIEGLNIESG
ncbi:MAG: hypothetical protein JO011_07090 [Ktedonobacteraceae bacterium]|nr:hypothetical protein [Ktedonobacteraceae bacterium]